MALIAYVSSVLHRDEEGQGLAEYALILALIAIVAIVALHLPRRPGQQGPEHGRQLDLAPRRRDWRGDAPQDHRGP